MKNLRQEQAGFRKGRGTIEQIYILRNIIEQSVEWQASLYVNFVDFQKAFDSPARERIWQYYEDTVFQKSLYALLGTGTTAVKVQLSMKEASQIGLKSLQALSKVV